MIRFFKSLSAYQVAVLQLILAGALWGGSFIAVIWGLKSFSTSSLIFWRFSFAFILGELFFYLFNRKDFFKPAGDIKASLWAGLALGLTILLQTHGLHFTTATKSSFITSLYVVLLPFVALLFFRQKIKLYHVLFGLLAFVGMGFLLNLHLNEKMTFTLGDGLTLACALVSAFHILFIGTAAKKLNHPFRFNTYQNLWALLLIIPYLLYEILADGTKLWPEDVQWASLLSILFLAILVSLGAFFLQVIAQKNLSSTTASLLCLLEAPFAFIFALLLLGEKVVGLQWIGIFLILGSSCLSIYKDRPQNGSH